MPIYLDVILYAISLCIYCCMQSEDVAVKSMQCNIKFSDACITDLNNVSSSVCV